MPQRPRDVAAGQKSWKVRERHMRERVERNAKGEKCRLRKLFRGHLKKMQRVTFGDIFVRRQQIKDRQVAARLAKQCL